MLKSLSATKLDVKLLLLSTFLRRASFGLTNQVLTLFLESAGVSKTRIGVFMTLTLVGDTAISFFLTWFSDKLGRRLVMVTGCVLMLASGLVFAKFLDFWVLLAAAIVGVISTSGDETGPFKTIEEACLSHLSPHKLRAHVFAIYGLLGTFGAAIGSSICGWLVDYWSVSRGWSLESCYRAIFLCYSGIAVAKLLLCLMLSASCEISDALLSSSGSEELYSGEIELTAVRPVRSGSTHEETHLLGDEVLQEVAAASTPSVVQTKSGLQALTKRYLPRLLVVFMLDSFGYGFMPPAWIVYYFRTAYHAPPAALGTLFFFTNLIDSISSLASAFTFSVFGPVKAIIVAQVPSAIFFSTVPFWHSFMTAAAFYFLFCACATMDVVPRQSLLTTIIPKEDLIKVLGIVNIGKTFARCIGPLFTGKLAQHGLLYIAFLVNGACLVLADLILGVCFVHLDKEVLELHK